MRYYGPRTLVVEESTRPNVFSITRSNNKTTIQVSSVGLVGEDRDRIRAELQLRLSNQWFVCRFRLLKESTNLLFVIADALPRVAHQRNICYTFVIVSHLETLKSTAVQECLASFLDNRNLATRLTISIINLYEQNKKDLFDLVSFYKEYSKLSESKSIVFTSIGRSILRLNIVFGLIPEVILNNDWLYFKEFSLGGATCRLCDIKPNNLYWYSRIVGRPGSFLLQYEEINRSNVLLKDFDSCKINIAYDIDEGALLSRDWRYLCAVLFKNSTNFESYEQENVGLNELFVRMYLTYQERIGNMERDVGEQLGDNLMQENESIKGLYTFFVKHVSKVDLT